MFTIERERERVYLPQNRKNIENHSKLTIVAGYQIGKPIKLVAYNTNYIKFLKLNNIIQQSANANGCAMCSGYARVKINEFNIQKIIQNTNSYSRILCSLLTNETVEVIDLISSGKEFHCILLIFGPQNWQINPHGNCL